MASATLQACSTRLPSADRRDLARWVAPALAATFALASCSTAASGPRTSLDASGSKVDVIVNFGKADAKTAKDAALPDAAADIADVAAKTDVSTPADLAAPPKDLTVDPPDLQAAEVEAPGDAAAPADTADPPDLVADVTVAPDIPGCVVSTEVCNEVDDDCDGKTDESCDDGEPCTVDDVCNITMCLGKLKDCNDGDACTADGCTAGSCQHQLKPCDDKDACTADVCDKIAGCQHTGTSDACDDGNLCTVADDCSKGYCAGQPLGCDDANPCTNDACDKLQGCTQAANSATCDDGNPCTATDVCAGGSCTGSGGTCDDGNACTDDSCDGGTCGHLPNAGACSDGDACTLPDACTEGTCVAGASMNCDDGLACTTDSCNAGACKHADTCGAGSACDAATNACKLTGCALPANACANGSQDRLSCTKARVIGRSVAKTAAGFKISDDTCYDGNNSQVSNSNCWDTGYDHSYRIFLRKGEIINMSLSGWDCGFTSFSVWEVIKVIQDTTGCGEPTSKACGKSAACTSDASLIFTAPAEGWFNVVVDTDTSGEGTDYTFTLKLNPASCQSAGCECP